MDWRRILVALDRGQREGDSASVLASLRDVLADLSIDAGFGANLACQNLREIESVFAEASKLLASKHPLVRKLAGWILLIVGNNENFLNGQLHLLAVNSLVANGTTHPDFVTRGKALAVSRQLSYRAADAAAELKLNAGNLNAKAMDDSEYVRRLAVLHVETEKADAVERLVDLLEAETDPLVIVNAFLVLAAVETGASRLTKQICFSSLSKLTGFTEPGKASFLVVLTELTADSKVEWTSEDVIALLNLLDDDLDGSGAAILVMAARFLLLAVRAASIKNDLPTQIYNRLLPSLWKQFDKGPEISHEMLDFLLVECESDLKLCQLLSRNGIDWCHISPRDPVFLVLKKIKMLVKLATNCEERKNPPFLHSILSQLFTWTSATRHAKIAEASLMAVTRIRTLSMKTLLGASDGDGVVIDDDESQTVFQRCMDHVLGLLDQPSPNIVASALNALRDALEDFDEFSVDVGKEAASAADDDGDDGIEAETYLHQLMSKIPRCIAILENAKSSSRQKAVSALLFFIERYSWALSRTKPAYILEDLFHKHIACREQKVLTTKVKLEFLSTTVKCFVVSPNETLPLLKDATSHFNKDPDTFLHQNSHKFFYIFDSS